MTDLPTVDLSDFGIPNEKYWKDFANKHSGGASISASPPRSAWEVLKDSIVDALANNPLTRGNEAERENDLIRQYGSDHNQSPAQVEATIRQNQAQRAAEIKESHASRDLRMSDEQRRRSTGGKVTAKAAEVVGNIVGDVNPTYAVPGLGSTALARILAMGGVSGASDLAEQLYDVREGVRDRVDPAEVLTTAAGGSLLQGGGEAVVKGVKSAASALRISAGGKMPNFGDLLDTVLHLEGGGTEANPKVSPKGAKGPMQVMDDTARDPGFGIRPWNGKTEADRARVGRQLLAALNHKYEGDATKVLAAYNAGSGRVDSLVAEYSGDWWKHLPSETRDYLAKGLDHYDTSVRTKGVPPIHPDEIASIMNDPEATGRMPSDELADVAPVVNIADARQAKEDAMNDGVIDENLDIADRINRGIDTGHVTEQHLPYITSARDNLQGILEDFDEKLNRSQKDRIQDNIDSLNTSIAKLTPPVADKPDVVDSVQPIRASIEPNEPANLNEDVSIDPTKSLLEYTDPEWKQLSKEQQDAIVKADTADRFPDLYPRDTNPPASSGTFGTQTPEMRNRKPPVKSPEGHEEGEDLRSIKTDKKLVLDKLGDVLDQTTPLRREAEEILAKERARRLAQVYATRKKKGGEAGFYSELAALKGSMGRPKIESIRDQFTQDEIDKMYDIVKNSPALEGYETVQAQQALNKLLGADYGEIPTAREVELLATAMPQKMKVWRALLEDESGRLNYIEGSVPNLAANILGIPRTLKASFDFSAPFRQGMFLVGRKEFWKAMPGMFKSFFSEGHFQQIQDEIFNRPTYELMNRAGLQTTKASGGVLQREEAFVSQFAEKIPGVRHSERAYLAFLNKVRADVFDDFVRKGDELGIDFIDDPDYLKSAARFINAATGRGTIRIMSRNAEILSNVLFSPKLMASRIQLLNPGFYVGLHPEVRKEAAKSGLIYASTVMSILGLAGAAGADVEMDPRSSDFAKIKVGNTRFDVTGGFQPYVRFYAQFLTGQQKGINDGVVRNIGWVPDFIRKHLPGVDQGAYKPTTRKDIVYRFFENKEAPNAAEVTRLLQGSDPVGNPLTLQSEAVNLFAPLIVSDTYQAYQDLGAKGLLTAAPNALGVGVQTYTPKKKGGQTVKMSDFAIDGSDFGKTNTVSLKDFQ
jgi:soluble lytic murein transglycosylase